MMPFYFGKHIESAHVGRRIASVTCDKCGCQYFYELARIGSGSGTAPYGIGAAAVTRSAEEQSQRDLQERLAAEAELVPCPKCHWISEDLVRGYRLGRYRRLGMFALGVGFFGTIASLICAWFISIGPAADRGSVPHFLFGGPAFFVMLAVGMILFRSWMRSRIRPNRDFPLAPTVPVGSPPALLFDESCGELRAAKPNPPEVGFTVEWVDFQVGRSQLPPLCCHCLQPASPESAYKLPIQGAINIDVPRCTACARRSKRAFWRIWFLVVAVGLLLGTPSVALLGLDSAEFWITLGGSLPILCALAAFTASTMTSPFRLMVADGSRGIVRLRFRNANYARMVAKHLSDSSPDAG